MSSVDAPRRIRLGTLLRRGLPLRIACRPACGARVRLLVPPRRSTAAQRVLQAGPAPKPLRLRVTRRAAVRVRAVGPRRLIVRVTFTRAGERPRVLETPVRLAR